MRAQRHACAERDLARNRTPCAVSAALYGPNPSAFSGAAARRFGCDEAGYATFTPGPGEGGRYHRAEHTRAVRGRAAIGFRPATVGRWRVRASFDGTIGAGSSQTGFAELLVVSRGSG